MEKKMSTLNFQHDESIRHNDARHKAVKRFYFALSDYKDIWDFIEKNNELKTDERRAHFICALAKDIFVREMEHGSSFAVPTVKCTFKDKIFYGEKLNIKINTGEVEKIVSVSAEMNDSWDQVIINYKFDCFSLAEEIFIDEKTKGETKITIDSDPKPEEREKKYRDDEDIKFVIDILYGALKESFK